MTTDAVRHPKNRPASVTLRDSVSARGLLQRWAFRVRKGACLCQGGRKSCVHAPWLLFAEDYVQGGVCTGDVHGLCGHGGVFPVHVLLCSMSTRVAASTSLASEQNPDIRERFAGAQIIA